jgi:hypothetical protein
MATSEQDDARTVLDEVTAAMEELSWAALDAFQETLMRRLRRLGGGSVFAG